MEEFYSRSIEPGVQSPERVSPSILTEYAQTLEGTVELVVTRQATLEFIQSLSLPTNGATVLFGGLVEHATYWHQSVSGSPPLKLGFYPEKRPKSCDCPVRRIEYLHLWYDKLYGTTGLCPFSLIKADRVWDIHRPVQTGGLGKTSRAHLGRIAGRLADDLGSASLLEV